MRAHACCPLVLLLATHANADGMPDFLKAASSKDCGATERIIHAATEADALLYRAMLYDLGSCYPLDAIAAGRLYEQSAKAGNAEAMYSIWFKMAQSVGSQNAPTEAERSEALRWLFRAGELKNDRAAWMLWQFYEYALYGYERDAEKAAYWKQVYEANRPQGQKS